MQVPLEMTFRGVSHTPDVDEVIRSRAQKLERYCDGIISCRVTVEKPQSEQRFGNPFSTRVEVTLPPNKMIVASKGPADHEMHVPLAAVIRSAFDAAARQIKEAAEVRRGDVKTHEEPRALVTRLEPGPGYGFLQTPDGEELYFHQNSVLHGDFERLTVGTEVRYERSEGEKGPQASTVQIESKQGPSPERARQSGHSATD